MEIKLTIPDWAVGRNIYILAGKELLAYADYTVEKKDGKATEGYAPLRVKDSRCNGCGECCDGCVFLGKDGCSFGGNIPLGCVVSDCGRVNSYLNCTERFK